VPNSVGTSISPKFALAQLAGQHTVRHFPKRTHRLNLNKETQGLHGEN